MATEIDKSVGELKIQEILTEEQWKQQLLIDPCDVVVKDGRIDRYPTKKILGVQYYDRSEQNRYRNLIKNLTKKYGDLSTAYAAYVNNVQDANLKAQTGNAQNWIDYNKGISDVKMRPIYFIGGGLLLFIILVLKNTK